MGHIVPRKVIGECFLCGPRKLLEYMIEPNGKRHSYKCFCGAYNSTLRVLSEINEGKTDIVEGDEPAKDFDKGLQI